MVNNEIIFHGFMLTMLIIFLLAVGIVDYYTMRIPNSMMIIGAITGILYRTGLSIYDSNIKIVVNGILGMLVGAGIIGGIMLFSLLILKKEGMGMGDLKYLGVIGLFLGSRHTLYTIFIAIMLGGCYATVVLVRKQQDIFPFGPFLSLGAMITILWGDDLWSVYMMDWVKKDNGYTLLEIILVLSLAGILLSLLWTSYLSVYRTYLKTNKKAQGLEEGQMVVNFINDTLQTYQMESCQVIVDQKIKELEEEEEGILSQIILRDHNQKVVLKYNRYNQTMTFQTQEISSYIDNCIVSYHDQLLVFNITMTQKGNGVIPDQKATIRTTANLQYN